jgi:hypothetical protein
MHCDHNASVFILVVVAIAAELKSQIDNLVVGYTLST